MNGRQAGVIGGAIGLLALLGLAASASASEPSGGEPMPDPEDCETMRANLENAQAARQQMQADANELEAQINASSNPEEIEALNDARYTVLANIQNINGTIAQLEAQLENCS